MDLLELVQAAQQGDKSSFTGICERFRPLVRKYAKQTYLKIICGDAEAEAWLAVAKAVRQYDVISGVPVAGFIESRVKYAVWNFYKREKRRWQQEIFLNGTDEEDDLLSILPDSVNIAEEVENRLIGKELEKALIMLPEKQRQAIILTVVGGRSLTETAQKLGVTAQAIYNLRQRGIARLKMLCRGMYTSERR